MTEERWSHIGIDDAWAIYVGAVVGEAHLANELLRVGLADDEDGALQTAAAFRPILLAAADEAREEGR